MCKTYQQFSIFRFFFGIYLFYHFYELLPYSKELFTGEGMISAPNLIPTWIIFPALKFIDSNIETFMCALMVCSLLLCFGIRQFESSLVLWYGWAYLINRNIFMSNPGIPYVGLFLLVCAIFPNSKSKWNNNWVSIHWVVWFLMAMGYTVSGIHKLQCQSWLDGTALLHVMNSPLARDTAILHWVLEMPLFFIQLATWGSLALEMSVLPIGIFYYARPFYWFALVAMHIGVIVLINFTDLTLGMLMVHLFTFDPDWLCDLEWLRISKKN